MHFQSERCLSCGNRDKGDIKPFGDTTYWFCCDQCYCNELNKYIAPRYQIGKLVQDDELNQDIYYDFDREGPYDSKKHHARVQAAKDKWNEQQQLWIEDAKEKLHPRIYAEYEADIAEQAEKERLTMEKEAERERRDQERERERDRRELEKQAEKDRKELEKQQQLQAEREAGEAAFQEMIKPKPIPFQYRFDHTHVIAGSGQGKSTLLIQQFLDDLKCNPANHPAIVVIDPKGTMVDQLRRLNCFQVNDNEFYTTKTWKFPHMVIIDPTLFPPALNMFAPPKRTYAPNVAQQLENNAISLFQYVFSSKGSSLTDKQLTCFSFAVSLVLTIPDATIHTFLV